MWFIANHRRFFSAWFAPSRYAEAQRRIILVSVVGLYLLPARSTIPSKAALVAA